MEVNAGEAVIRRHQRRSEEVWVEVLEEVSSLSEEGGLVMNTFSFFCHPTMRNMHGTGV